MNRRSFVGTALCPAFLAPEVTGCQGKSPDGRSTVARELPPAAENGKLAGMTLDELRRQYEHDLFEDHLPFHDRYVVNRTYGSFMSATGHDGSHPHTNTTASYMGRGIWFYSFLYNNFAQEDAYLDTAARAVGFIMKHRPSGEDYWPDEYTCEGDVIGSGRGSLPGDCYIAEGLAEYAKAAGEPEYMDLARATMLKTFRHYDDPGFIDSSTPYPGARSLWYWMLHMWFGTTTLMHHPDSDLEKIVTRSIDAIMNYHLNPAFNLMNNVINHDLSRSEDPKHSGMAACGHATEATWMIMYEAVRTKDKTLFGRAADMFRRHAVVSKDDVYGGYYNDCRNVDANDWELNKVSWAQAFILINSLYIAEHTGAQWAQEIFGDQNIWTQKKLTLKQYGYPGWFEPSDRFATFVPHATRKDNYHHPRHLMLNLLSVRRMIERGGKISGVFV